MSNTDMDILLAPTPTGLQKLVAIQDVACDLKVS